MIMKRILGIIAFTLGALVGVTSATHATTHTNDTAHAHAAVALSEGEIRKIDKEAKKLTIRHGPLENLGMPAMTMVFQVRDAALLDPLKAGDKVKFTANKDAGAYVVTQIEVSK
jgi:Cu/Ag efflux protein CusF